VWRWTGRSCCRAKPPPNDRTVHSTTVQQYNRTVVQQCQQSNSPTIQQFNSLTVQLSNSLSNRLSNRIKLTSNVDSSSGLQQWTHWSRTTGVGPLKGETEKGTGTEQRTTSNGRRAPADSGPKAWWIEVVAHIQEVLPEVPQHRE
jgi:hypothetical protein